MRNPIKVIVQKSMPTKGDWMRFRTVAKILIDDMSSIKTEAELCWYMYSNWGEGRYMCLGFQKGRSGFWRYWIGQLNSMGFCRDKNKNKEVEKLKVEFAKATSYEEKEMVQEDISLTREINEMTKSTSIACKGIIKYRAGILHAYDEPPPTQ